MNILITGKDGYVASNLFEFLISHQHKCRVIDMLDSSWDKVSFKDYDVVIHTSALVHKKEKRHSLEEYMNSNAVLTQRLCIKAKEEKVKSFIFLSTEAVYGLEPSLKKEIIIDDKTELKPVTKYGKSKLEAENQIAKLNDYTFKVSILRCPIIYGNKCRGNYNGLRKLALKLRRFPNLENKKSFLFIGNLCHCILHIIDSGFSGYISPQDKEYHSTKQIALLIKEANGLKPLTSNFLAFLVKIFYFLSPIKKAFGNTMIDKKLSSFKDGFDYQIFDINKAIEITEKRGSL